MMQKAFETGSFACGRAPTYKMSIRIPHLPSQDVRPDEGISNTTDEVARGLGADVDLGFFVMSGKEYLLRKTGAHARVQLAPVRRHVLRQHTCMMLQERERHPERIRAR